MWFMRSGVTPEYAMLKIFATLIVIFLVMPFHEFAHGFVAYKLGDNTAKNYGRLSFNPLRHIDPIGALAILLLGVGWAKPVPIDPRNFKNRRLGTFLVALAGPFSNLLSAFLGGVILNAVIANAGSLNTVVYIAEIFLEFFISLNVGLAVFNLIPVPPLDGSKILEAFLPNRVVYKMYSYQRIISAVLFFAVFLGVLSYPIQAASVAIYNWIMYVTGLPFGNLWSL